MDWNDLLNNKGHDSFFDEEQLELEQPLISKKQFLNAYSVERKYVNCKEFHNKFEMLPVNRDVQQALYIQAGRLLEKVDGYEQEYMLAINARTGEFLVDNFGRLGDIKGTGFNEAEMAAIENCSDNIILMHNHSLNGRPSAQDLLTYLKEDNLKLSLIVCHDGTIYAICNVHPKLEEIYEQYKSDLKEHIVDNEMVKRLATTKLYKLNERLSERHKIFEVIEL